MVPLFGCAPSLAMGSSRLKSRETPLRLALGRPPPHGPRGYRDAPRAFKGEHMPFLGQRAMVKPVFSSELVERTKTGFASVVTMANMGLFFKTRCHFTSSHNLVY